MPRLTPVFRSVDYPGTPDAETKTAVADLFASMFPGVAEPVIDPGHAGIAIAALSPALALRLGEMSRFLALDLPWSQRRDLRELAIQTVNWRLECAYAFGARLAACEAAGLNPDMMAGLDDWQSNGLFDPDQQLVIDYAENVVASTVTDALSARLVAKFGEKGAVECTAVIAFWSFWALFLNAARADG